MNMRTQIIGALETSQDDSQIIRRLKLENRRLKMLLKDADYIISRYAPGMDPSLEKYCIKYEKLTNTESRVTA